MCWRAQWSMWDRIQAVRNQELGTLWKSFIIQAFFGFTLNTIPVLVSVLTFGVYVLLGHRLTAAEAFTSLSLFTVRAAPRARHCPTAFSWCLFRFHANEPHNLRSISD